MRDTGSLLPSVQNGEPAVLGVRLDAGEPLDVEQERAVDPDETRAIELRLDVRHRLLFALALAP